ncbi:hypothetical protein LIP_0959 [Limnochorda pilosa]|uniref:Uncharacterized protein n=1 Tax=Limnochorda pilosa TaxID=1555112 RepID=A0A0K2SI63_LIMPI|nr:hypothetical protein LIP_0959 [Limnochorda pilosa]
MARSPARHNFAVDHHNGSNRQLSSFAGKIGFDQCFAHEGVEVQGTYRIRDWVHELASDSEMEV